MLRRCLVAGTVLLTLGGLGVVDAASAAAPSTIGAPGDGDPYFPLQGNGGYDAKHYGVNLRYEPKTHALRGLVRMQAVTTKRLSRFNLDLRHSMHATSVMVNGRPAVHRQPGNRSHELVITPAAVLPAHRSFSVTVRYAGNAHAIKDPDGALDGWIHTNDGAFVANEPQGSPTWFPVNNTPRDKATYTMSINVPRGYVAASNGRSYRAVHKDGRTIWRYNLTTPVSDYLITATVGHFNVHRGRTSSGIPYTVFIDPSQRSGTNYILSKMPKIIDFYSTRYGRYPFGRLGAIVDHAPNVGYALETATRPLFPGTPDELTLAHEFAHQWYGDTLTCKRWRDIWVNEGFAEFSDWMWDQHRGGKTMHQHLQELLARPASSSSFSPPPGNPGGVKNIFAGSVYDRGAGTLEALREKLGNPTFFKIMRGWLNLHRHANATTVGFTRYAAQVSHRDLSQFFDRWLYRNSKP